MRQLIAFIALIFVFFAFGNSQNLSKLNSKYKKFNGSSAAYVFNDKIWFSVEKSANGKVCTMVIYPKRNLYEKLKFTEFLDALDSIIPPDERGAKEDSFISGATGGGFGWTIFQYENVNFTFPYQIDLKAFEKIEEFSFDNFSNIPESTEATGKSFQKVEVDDFAPYRDSDYETTSVRWKIAECSAK